MATLWLAKEGPEPTSGEPFRQIALSECITRLDLSRRNYLDDKRPRFNVERSAAFGARESLLLARNRSVANSAITPLSGDKQT